MVDRQPVVTYDMVGYRPGAGKAKLRSSAISVQRVTVMSLSAMCGRVVPDLLATMRQRTMSARPAQPA